MYKALLILAATTAFALPQQPITSTSTFGVEPTTAPPAAPPPEAPPAAPQHGPEFSLMMSVGVGESSTYVSLNAVRNGTADSFVLVGERLSAYPGTPAYINGTSPHEALILDINGAAFGVQVPDVGHTEGLAVPVTAVKDYQEFKFDVQGGRVNHELTAATNTWLACDSIVNGQKNSVLSWGTFSAGMSVPDGCVLTNVYQNCNVAGSTATCQ